VVNDDATNEGTLEMLADLGRTWITHFLFVCHKREECELSDVN
jgi:hypothetical protein